jgi:hypothetical protein
VGVNTTLFTAFDAVALRPLPVTDPDRVVRLERWFDNRAVGNVQYFSPSGYVLRLQRRIASMVAYSGNFPLVARIDGQPENFGWSPPTTSTVWASERNWAARFA